MRARALPALARAVPGCLMPANSLRRPLPLRADCPQDHLLDLSELDKYQQWLPRQHTFLQHEDMPAAVKASRANVSLAAFSGADPQQLGAMLDALRDPSGLGGRRVLSVSSIPDVYRMLHSADQVGSARAWRCLRLPRGASLGGRTAPLPPRAMRAAPPHPGPAAPV